MHDLLKDMDESGIDKSVVLYWPFDDMFTKENPPSIESVVENAAQVGKGRISVAGSLQLMGAGYERGIRGLDDALKARAIVALKVYLGYEPLEPTDPLCQPVYDLSQRYDVPVIFHTGDTFDNIGLARHTHPLNVDEIAKQRPGMNVVIAHLGNPWITDAALVVGRNKNVYADISGLLSYNQGSPEWDKRYEKNAAQGIESAIAWCGGPQKLLFGSDSPLFKQDRYIKFVKSLGLSDDELETVMHKNAARLFRI
jgi:predicted TIM-barrel fold metal-dependent hydrolase